MHHLSRRSFLETASAVLVGLLAGRSLLGPANGRNRTQDGAGRGGGSGAGPMAGPVALSEAIAQAGRPNVLLLVADDLGWADVGYQGDEAQPPTATPTGAATASPTAPAQGHRIHLPRLLNGDGTEQALPGGAQPGEPGRGGHGQARGPRR